MKINWKIFKEILYLAIPAVGEMTLYMMIWIFDTMMIGKYGGQLAVSSVGLSTEIIYSFFNIIIAVGVSTALTSLISRAIGSKDYKKAEIIANAGIKIAVVLALIFFSLLFFVPDKILNLAGATKEMLPLATRYAKISSFSFFLLTLSSTTNGIFRGIKDTKTSLYVAGSINIVNLFLDYVLIFGNFGFPEWGITGAAVATVAGNFIGILLQWSRLKKLPFKISLFSYVSKKDIWEIIRFAVPSGLQEANFSLSRLLGLTFILSLGTTAFAANQIGIAIEAISTMPGWGVAIACTALVGHSIGENNPNKSQEYTLYSTIIASIFMGILACFFFFIPKTLVSFFINKQEIDVIKIGAICLQVAAFEQIPIAIVTVLGSYFKGIGNPKTPFYVSFFTNWFLRLPIAFYLISILRLPVYIYWFITTFQWLVESVVLYYLYRKNIIKR
ncbi:MATE family efflux transporter [Fusobacterium animalis]|uniref:Multidrug-efflux transporter n=1 Tax=Fusobacterium nucleatum TaxID=851 RepID=A0A133NFG0_FUSNU|nr:MATE family efflux transporter [Fusobacterium nucleatum]KXA15036.1 MATE efflux family protein [Fusobacterium nucleatum]MCL4576994.1 multidrug transporter MatE [Fusobacterium nucleatum YWH7056]MCL4583268.1 multidrug transporter MatE [Fusobacterium nucleatum YWH7054]MCL4591433.1 multidrug transporter MatE [Fusobacterium nucleatum YWH7053]